MASLTVYHTIPTLNDPEKHFENIMGRGENAGHQHFLIFPYVFYVFREKEKSPFQQHLFCRLQMLSIWPSLKFYLLVKSQPFLEQALFSLVCKTSLFKTLLEKDKLLIMSNSSFFHSVFYPFGELFAIFIEFKIVVCKLLKFGRVQILSFGKGLYLGSANF